MPFNIDGKPYNLYELIRRADDGDIEAMFYVVCAIDLDGLAQDDPDGEIADRRISYLKKLAETEGYENTLIMLGTSYQMGKDVKQDAAEAIKWFEKAVSKGIPFGNECIGSIYYNGDGVSVDYQKAFEYFTKDDCKKSFCTLYPLGEMYRRGLYVEKNLETAIEYYRGIVYSSGKHKEEDDYYWRACYRLGTALHYGWGVERNLNEAVKMLKKAKDLFEARSINAMDTDITKEELLQEWLLVNQDAGTF